MTRIRPDQIKPSATNGHVLTTTGGAAVWAAASGGGGGSAVQRRVHRATAAFGPGSSTTWADLGPTVTIPAVAGNVLAIKFGGSFFIDVQSTAITRLGLVVNGTVRHSTSLHWWANLKHTPISLATSYIVVAGDIVSSNVTVKVQYRQVSGSGNLHSVYDTTDQDITELSVHNLGTPV